MLRGKELTDNGNHYSLVTSFNLSFETASSWLSGTTTCLSCKQSRFEKEGVSVWFIYCIKIILRQYSKVLSSKEN